MASLRSGPRALLHQPLYTPPMLVPPQSTQSAAVQIRIDMLQQCQHTSGRRASEQQPATLHGSRQSGPRGPHLMPCRPSWRFRGKPTSSPWPTPSSRHTCVRLTFVRRTHIHNSNTILPSPVQERLPRKGAAPHNEPTSNHLTAQSKGNGLNRIFGASATIVASAYRQ